LANAWRVVLSDPNYKERRPFEERKHTAEEQALTLGEAARETSQSRGTEANWNILASFSLWQAG
jgi:hypothetical protein